MIEDNPAWARGTPRQVKDMLLDALAARDPNAKHRKALAADMLDCVELLAGQAHPYDANRRLVAHLYNERNALFTFSPIPTCPPRTGERNKVSDPPSSTARYGAGTGPGGAPQPRAA
jgi:hypothetical protein